MPLAALGLKMAYAISVKDVVASPTTIIQASEAMNTSFPIENVAIRQVSTVAKTSGVIGEITITIENYDLNDSGYGFGEFPLIAILGIHAPGVIDYSIYVELGVNFGTPGQANYYIKSDSAFNRPFDLANNDGRGEFTHGWFYKFPASGGGSATFARITITPTNGVQTGPLEIGRIWIGPTLFATERNSSLVSGLLIGGNSSQSVGGQAYGSLGKSLRQGQVTIEKLTDAQKMNIMRGLSYAGYGRPMIYMRSTSDVDQAACDYRRDNSFYCHLEGEVSCSSQATRELNTITFGFIEER